MAIMWWSYRRFTSEGMAKAAVVEIAEKSIPGDHKSDARLLETTTYPGLTTHRMRNAGLEIYPMSATLSSIWRYLIQDNPVVHILYLHWTSWYWNRKKAADKQDIWILKRARLPWLIMTASRISCVVPKSRLQASKKERKVSWSR